MFRDICILLEGGADEKTDSRLEQATRVVRSGAEWRSARGAAAAPPSECTFPKGGIQSSMLDTALGGRLEALERQLRDSRAPSICIQSPVDVRLSLSHSDWADVEAVVAAVARWCATRSVQPTIYIVDSRSGRLDTRQALTVPAAALGVDPVRLARAARLSTHKIQPTLLTAQGGFYSSNPDILHNIWWSGPRHNSELQSRRRLITPAS
jgi:hypothetical protein